MVDTEAIKARMEVLGADGAHVGIVERLKSPDRIVLAKDDPKSGGRPHIIPADWVERVDDKVRLKKSARDAMAQWQAAA